MDVSIKDFQRNVYKYLNELPITLTKYGKPFALVTSTKVATKEEVATTPTEKVATEKKVVYCKHGRPKELCNDFRCRET